MSSNKPYYRIFIPQKGCSIMENLDYLSDSRFGNTKEMESLANAARIIIKDYLNLTDFVEPTDENKNVFSHKIFELLLRTATEFEANCKGILKANGYINPKNIEDYHKLNSLMKLDKYEISSSLWNSERKVVPFSEWSHGHRLSWYKAYNDSKHNRYANFQLASLENLFIGINCLIVILAAQSPIITSRISDGYIATSNTSNEIIFNNITVKYPYFEDNQKYDFNWNELKMEIDPFRCYSFI